MTVRKQETPPRSQASKETAVAALKASDKQGLDARGAGRAKGHATKISQESGIDKDERRQMITEAAYYRYQNRGCGEGCDVDDWLAAEEEIDRLLDF